MPRPRIVPALILPLLLALPAAGGQPGKLHVVLVTTDGLRPEEVFAGADDAMMNQEHGGVTDATALRERFGGETPEVRRKALMPFLWEVVAKDGQLLGDAGAGSPARVTNGKNFSYPGYNELLTGRADPRIDSNAKRPNPNLTVLEWLDARPGYRQKVGAVTSWDVFPFILNRDRGGLFVNAGWEPIGGGQPTEVQALLNRLIQDTHRLWPDSRYDSLTVEVAMDYLRTSSPRALFVSLGDTDEFAHEGRYDLYLDAAHRADAFVQRLWETIQSRPDYRGRTTLIVTTDHGRGPAPDAWKDHGADVPGADAIWIGLIGPMTPPLGLRAGAGAVSQAQVAATVAAALGEDYRADHPDAAPPLPDAIRPTP